MISNFLWRFYKNLYYKGLGEGREENNARWSVQRRDWEAGGGLRLKRTEQGGNAVSHGCVCKGTSEVDQVAGMIPTCGWRKWRWMVMCSPASQGLEQEAKWADSL